MAKTVAKLLNITYRTYQKYETEEFDPPTSKTITLADYFNITNLVKVNQVPAYLSLSPTIP